MNRYADRVERISAEELEEGKKWLSNSFSLIRLLHWDICFIFLWKCNFCMLISCKMVEKNQQIIGHFMISYIRKKRLLNKQGRGRVRKIC